MNILNFNQVCTTILPNQIIHIPNIVPKCPDIVPLVPNAPRCIPLSIPCYSQTPIQQCGFQNINTQCPQPDGTNGKQPTKQPGKNPGGTTPGGTNPGGTNPGGTTPGGTNPGGSTPGGTNPGGGNGGTGTGTGTGSGSSGTTTGSGSGSGSSGETGTGTGTTTGSGTGTGSGSSGGTGTTTWTSSGTNGQTVSVPYSNSTLQVSDSSVFKTTTPDIYVSSNNYNGTIHTILEHSTNKVTVIPIIKNNVPSVTIEIQSSFKLLNNIAIYNNYIIYKDLVTTGTSSTQSSGTSTGTGTGTGSGATTGSGTGSSTGTGSRTGSGSGTGTGSGSSGSTGTGTESGSSGSTGTGTGSGSSGSTGTGTGSGSTTGSGSGSNINYPNIYNLNRNSTIKLNLDYITYFNYLKDFALFQNNVWRLYTQFDTSGCQNIINLRKLFKEQQVQLSKSSTNKVTLSDILTSDLIQEDKKYTIFTTITADEFRKMKLFYIRFKEFSDKFKNSPTYIPNFITINLSQFLNRFETFLTENVVDRLILISPYSFKSWNIIPIGYFATHPTSSYYNSTRLSFTTDTQPAIMYDDSLDSLRDQITQVVYAPKDNLIYKTYDYSFFLYDEIYNDVEQISSVMELFIVRKISYYFYITYIIQPEENSSPQETSLYEILNNFRIIGIKDGDEVLNVTLS